MMINRRVARTEELRERAGRNKPYGREALEVTGEPPASRPRVDPPGTDADADPALRRQLEVVTEFERHWALYHAYCEAALDDGRTFLPVQFQCVVDHDTKAVEELSGMIAV